MGKISKGPAASVSVLGSLCLIFGVCISVISWILASKAPKSISYTNGGFHQSTTYIPAYWWGGLGVSIYLCCKTSLKSCFSVFTEFFETFSLHRIIFVMRTIPKVSLVELVSSSYLHKKTIDNK